jgi:GABA(A) receptor-associated protein
MTEKHVYFKDKYTYEQRRKEAIGVLDDNPDRVPVIVERCKTCKDLNIIDKKKYLVPNDLKMSQLTWIIRKRLTLNESHSLFLSTDKGIIPTSGSVISIIYSEHKDLDGFLYFKYLSENTFGN